MYVGTFGRQEVSSSTIYHPCVACTLYFTLTLMDLPKMMNHCRHTWISLYFVLYFLQFLLQLWYVFLNGYCTYPDVENYNINALDFQTKSDFPNTFLRWTSFLLMALRERSPAHLITLSLPHAHSKKQLHLVKQWGWTSIP